MLLVSFLKSIDRKAPQANEKDLQTFGGSHTATPGALIK